MTRFKHPQSVLDYLFGKISTLAWTSHSKNSNSRDILRMIDPIARADLNTSWNGKKYTKAFAQ
jgi:hypothetical protein